MRNNKELEEIIKRIVEENNMELVEVNIKSSPNKILEVVIYKPEGVSFDDCTLISGEIDNRINMDDYFSSSFNLEVCSPGLDRKIKSDDDFRRNLGKKVEASLYSKVDNRKTIIGIIRSYDEENVVLEIAEDEDLLSLKRNNIAVMRQHIEF